MTFGLLVQIMMLVGLWTLTMLAIEVALPVAMPASSTEAVNALRQVHEGPLLEDHTPNLWTHGSNASDMKTTTEASSGLAGNSTLHQNMHLGAAGSEAEQYTYDCWKPILRETDPTPSKGRLLMDVLQDPRVKTVEVYNDEPEAFSMAIENIWGERFHVGPVLMPDGSIIGHAERI